VGALDRVAEARRRDRLVRAAIAERMDLDAIVDRAIDLAGDPAEGERLRACGATSSPWRSATSTT
jgi:hypothetical protein